MTAATACGAMLVASLAALSCAPKTGGPEAAPVEGAGGAGGRSASPPPKGDSGTEPPPPPPPPNDDAGLLHVVATDAAPGLRTDAACTAVEQAAEALPSTAADIVWIVDNSGSMTFEAGFVQDNLNTFSRLISGGGVDARVVLISAGNSSTTTSYTNGMCIRPPLGSGACPDDTSYPHLFHVIQTVDSNNALDLLMSTYTQWKGVLRPGVTKTFVVVTDDNSYTSAATFQTWVQGLPAFQGVTWRFSGIFCPAAGTECAATGTVYSELVTATGGVVGDLSKQDFAPVFQELASAVVVDAKPVDCEWTIPPPPQGQKLDPDAVNVKFTRSDGSTETLYGVADSASCDPALGGWYYDDPAKPTEVLACASSCREMQADLHAKVQVAFGCARKVIPIAR